MISMKKFIKIAGKCIAVLFTVLLALILIFNLLLGIQKTKTNTPYPTVAGIGIGVIITGSMSGTIEVDDMVITKAKDEYYVNDIVLFRENDSCVTHRIIDIREGKYITKGDANNTEDKDPVKKEDICGKVIVTVPKAGKWIEFLRSPLGYLILLTVGAALIFLPGRLSNKLQDKDDATDGEMLESTESTDINRK